MFITISQHSCSSLLLKCLYTSKFLITTGQVGQSSHVHIIVHLIIHNYWTSNYALLSLNIRHASSCIIIIGMHHRHRVCIIIIEYASSSSNIHHHHLSVHCLCIIIIKYTSYCIGEHHHTMVCMYIILYRSASTS